jgi:uncharacterized protein YggT (Ycf19 family)
MKPTASPLAHLYFDIPDFVLITLMCLVVGRLLLPIFVRDRDHPVARVVQVVTVPVVAPVRAITPRIVPDRLVLIFTVVWLFAARIAVFLGLIALGFRPIARM